jgi:hypothetical protein
VKSTPITLKADIMMTNKQPIYVGPRQIQSQISTQDKTNVDPNLNIDPAIALARAWRIAKSA